MIDDKIFQDLVFPAAIQTPAQKGLIVREAHLDQHGHVSLYAEHSMLKTLTPIMTAKKTAFNPPSAKKAAENLKFAGRKILLLFDLSGCKIAAPNLPSDKRRPDAQSPGTKQTALSKRRWSCGQRVTVNPEVHQLLPTPNRL